MCPKGAPSCNGKFCISPQTPSDSVVFDSIPIPRAPYHMIYTCYGRWSEWHEIYYVHGLIAKQSKPHYELITPRVSNNPVTQYHHLTNKSWYGVHIWGVSIDHDVICISTLSMNTVLPMRQIGHISRLSITWVLFVELLPYSDVCLRVIRSLMWHIL